MNRFLALTALAALLLSGVASCKKQIEEPVETIHFQLPQNLNLVYGETYKINLPENLKNLDALALSLDFSQTPNLAISSASRLHDKLTAGITVDAEKNQIIINTTLLYPSGAPSISGLRIPDNYNITVIAKSSHDVQIGKESLNFKISPGKIAIKGLEKKVNYHIPICSIAIRVQVSNLTHWPHQQQGLIGICQRLLGMGIR